MPLYHKFVAIVATCWRPSSRNASTADRTTCCSRCACFQNQYIVLRNIFIVIANVTKHQIEHPCSVLGWNVLDAVHQVLKVARL